MLYLLNSLQKLLPDFTIDPADEHQGAGISAANRPNATIRVKINAPSKSLDHYSVRLIPQKLTCLFLGHARIDSIFIIPMMESIAILIVTGDDILNKSLLC